MRTHILKPDKITPSQDVWREARVTQRQLDVQVMDQKGRDVVRLLEGRKATGVGGMGSSSCIPWNISPPPEPVRAPAPRDAAFFPPWLEVCWDSLFLRVQWNHKRTCLGRRLWGWQRWCMSMVRHGLLHLLAGIVSDTSVVCFLGWTGIWKGGCILTYILGVYSWDWWWRKGQMSISTLSTEIILKPFMGALCCVYSTGSVGCGVPELSVLASESHLRVPLSNPQLTPQRRRMHLYGSKTHKLFLSSPFTRAQLLHVHVHPHGPRMQGPCGGSSLWLGVRECLFISWDNWASRCFPLYCQSSFALGVSGWERNLGKAPIHLTLHPAPEPGDWLPPVEPLCYFCAWGGKAISLHCTHPTTPPPHLPTVFLADEDTL